MKNYPQDLGYYFPAEWYKHEATWLSWPHNEETWPELDGILPVYSKFVKEIAKGEEVRINVGSEELKRKAEKYLNQEKVDMSRIKFFFFPTNDSWCRDHGPGFIINNHAAAKKAILNWGYNAWGGKYPPFHDDDAIPALIAKHFNLSLYEPGIILEGGSVEFNGKGTVLTTTSCLLNPNRNPHLSKKEIEESLMRYYNVSNVLWLGDGIVGDDTDGHIDDITRFVNEDTVVTVVEKNRNDENYLPLQENLKDLKKMRLENGKQLNIVELPMPGPVTKEGLRLPASYANFYISNNSVIVPVFNDPNDDKALEIIQQFFPDREVVGLNSVDLIWGLGSFHCLSQQEPMVNPA